MNLLSEAEIYCPLCVLEGVRIIEVFFLKKIYENFVGTLETVHDIEVSVLETCPYREVRLYFFFSSYSFQLSVTKFAKLRKSGALQAITSLSLLDSYENKGQ